MKKMLSMLLALMLMTSCFCSAFAEDDGTTTFSPIMLGNLEMSIDELYATSQTRAYFSSLLLFDLIIYDIDLLSELSLKESSLVGKNGDFLFVFINGTNRDCLITYEPAINEARFMLINPISTAEAKSLLSSDFPDFYENDMDTVQKMGALLGEVGMLCIQDLNDTGDIEVSDAEMMAVYQQYFAEDATELDAQQLLIGAYGVVLLAIATNSTGE
ncbi:MAG: hypothetical protein IKK75_13335 [Clostridia bacterium]|nr:hypothetical protein [Clostridia bacterium]